MQTPSITSPEFSPVYSTLVISDQKLSNANHLKPPLAIIEISQVALSQLSSQSEQASIDKDRVSPLPEQDQLNLEIALKDQKIVESIAESLSDEKFILVENHQKESKQEIEEKGWLKEWALTGGIPLTGAAIGTTQQLLKNQTGFSVLQGLNLLKQIEIKNCAYVLPLAPLFFNLASKIYEDQSEDPFAIKVMKAAKALDKKELAFILMSCGISLATAGVHGALFKAGLFAFDLSGHMMTKTVSSAILAKGLTSEQSQAKPSFFKRIALYCYVASDALMLHKTTGLYHTPEETIAGAIWGLINLGVAQTLATKFNPSTPEAYLAIQAKAEEDTSTANSNDTPKVIFFNEGDKFEPVISEDYPLTSENHLCPVLDPSDKPKTKILTDENTIDLDSIMIEDYQGST